MSDACVDEKRWAQESKHGLPLFMMITAKPISLGVNQSIFQERGIGLAEAVFKLGEIRKIKC